MRLTDDDQIRDTAAKEVDPDEGGHHIRDAGPQNKVHQFLETCNTVCVHKVSSSPSLRVQKQADASSCCKLCAAGSSSDTGLVASVAGVRLLSVRLGFFRTMKESLQSMFDDNGEDRTLTSSTF
jgi:hypothetical protein